jgi:N-acetylmuramic acid 6-phosphate (MurNAc-6-P) etherase
VKVAVLMARRNLGAQKAVELLERHRGSLRAAL